MIKNADKHFFYVEGPDPVEALFLCNIKLQIDTKLLRS